MKSIRIGTRNSPLALWQAREVARHLQNLNYKTDIVPIVSSGDKNLSQPLYTMGITGIFTKDLDLALINNEIDVAVHSLKDVPTMLPLNIELIAVLERDFPADVLVRSSQAKNKSLNELTVASGSLRRRAFWNRVYPNTHFVGIRGNVQTRLKKLEEGLADATIFSQAGLERMKLNLEYEHLPFLLCAPSQGVVAIAGRKDDFELRSVLVQINHKHTEICTSIERSFLRHLEGGCTAPIGAYATISEGGEVHFQGRLCSLDGTRCLEVDEKFTWNANEDAGQHLADKILNAGGREIMEQIRTDNQFL